MRLLLLTAQKQTMLKRARWSLALLLFLQPLFFIISSPDASALSGVPDSVVVNEFSSSGSSDWAELYNTTANPITLTGWQLHNRAGTSVSLADTIAAHSFHIVTLSGDFLNDTTDTIRLQDDTPVEISALMYGAENAILASGPSESTARTQDGGVSWEVGTPTKGASNVVPDVVPPTSPMGGQPNGTLQNAGFNFTWLAPSDTQAAPLDFELRASMDGNQLTVADGLSTAWHSGLLHTSSMPASLVENLSVSNGIWYWQVRSVDAAGNRSAWSDTWSVDVDTSNPGIDLQSPAPGELFGKVTKPQVIIQSKTIEGRIKNYNVLLDGGDVSSQTEASPIENGLVLKTILSTESLTDGPHKITIRVEDAAGNVSIAERPFTVDNTALVLTTPLENNSTLQGTEMLQMDSNENGSYDVDIINSRGVSVKANTLAMSDDDENSIFVSHHAFTYKWDTTRVPDGAYTVRFTGVDSAGNITTLDRNVTVDNIFDGGFGTLTPIDDPLLERLSASLAEPFVVPQAVAVVPANVLPAPRDIDESTLALAGDSKTQDITADSLPSVAATENGWRILGILWHWWAMGVALLGLLGYRSWHIIKRHRATLSVPFGGSQ